MDRHRLRPIFERLQRSGASMVEVVGAGEGAKLAPSSFDCVVIDAPCSGSGAWRRKPDSKWRLTDKLLAQRIKDQRQVLERGAELVRPGGRLVYITCSVLAEENRDQAMGFLGAHRAFSLVPQKLRGATMDMVSLTPLRHQTDGFFIAVMRRES
jgi:16S rRNA (cytosine967-C5)-methyltransferase